MKQFLMAATLTLFTAAPLLAQTERAYLTGVGGFATSPDATSANLLAEAGVRIAPHLLVFGTLGGIRNLQPSEEQPIVDGTTASVAAAQGLNVLGTPRVPALYSIGGLRYEVPMQHRVSPYVLGGLGVARLSPTAEFTYTSGPLPDGSAPVPGADVTDQLETAGYFTAPAASNAFMFTLGGGVDVPVAQHWAVDLGYRFSRFNATTPLNAQGATFGFGYRF